MDIEQQIENPVPGRLADVWQLDNPKPSAP